jgi:Flp pilus assembly protein TadD
MKPSPSVPPAGSRTIPAAAWIAAIALATLLAYWPARSAGFVWDDDAHLTAPALRSWAGLVRIWSEPGVTQQYYPLLHSLFWLEHRLWGDAPGGYHLANLAWHILAAALAGRLLQRLAIPGAWLAAAIFALHPVQVESVAWISEQKNTLSAACYLGAALAWLSFSDHRRRRDYWLATSLFVLGLLTKTTVATLPAALLVIAWWRRGRIGWRDDIAPLAPWFVLGAAAGLFTAWVESHLVGAAGSAYELSWLQRLLLAGRVPWFYLGQLAWPANLVFIYPRWLIEPARLLAWLPLTAGVALTAALVVRRHRAALAAWLLFAGTLFPVLGFFNVYPFIYSFVADHFQYLAGLPVIALGAALVVRLPHVARAVAAGAILLGLGALTWRQAGDYRSAETLYRATVARNPDAWMAWNNLGYLELANPARNAEAIAHFQQALRLRPDYAEAQGNLGLALTQAGRPAEAVPHLQESLRLKPGPYQMHNNLGIALATSGRPAEALGAFRRAAALNPTLPNIEENWAKALLLLGRRDEAAEHFARAAQLRAAAGGSSVPVR